MRQISLMILLAALVVLAGGARVVGQEVPLRDVIAAQWDKYKERLKEYQFRQTFSHYDLLTGKQRVKYATQEYIRRGAWSLYAGESKEEGRGGCSVLAINSHYAFTLAKDKDTLAWRVGELNLDLSKGVQIAGMGSDPPDDVSHRYSPYCFGTIAGSLPTFLKRPGFSVTKTESAGTPEEGLSKVWFKVVADEISAKQQGQVPIEGTGWLLLDPKCYWRIREFELPFFSPRFPTFRALAKYHYNTARDNYPLLKQIDIAFYPPESSEKPETRTVIDYVFEKRVPDEKEFRLSGYGFPEPMGVPPVSSGTRWYLWISLTAFAALAIGALARKLKKRWQSVEPVKV